MSDLQIGIEADAASAVRALNEMGVDLLGVIEPELQRGALGALARLKTYPAPPPNSRYIRTGLYGRSWTGAAPVRRPGSIEVRFGNVRHYARYVGDPELQARVHRGRWTTTAQALQAQSRSISEDVSRAIRSAAGRYGLGG